jgi:cell division control protein 45
LVDALRDLVELANKQKTTKKGQEGEEKDKDPNALPFVIAALNEKEETYLVVGINASMQYGDVLRNNFGFRFNQAIQESNSRSKHDKFETSAVEVKKEDFSTFIEALHAVL